MKLMPFILKCVFIGMLHGAYANVTTSGINSARIDKTKSFIRYHMFHPMHHWDATSKDIDGIVQYDTKTLQISKVAIAIKVSSFDSKNSNRDSHMMEVIEALKYPIVTFVSTSVAYNSNNLDVTGNVTFHGISKSIHFTAQEQASNNHKIINGMFTLLLEDFKIERPSMMMMKTDNKIKFSFEVDVTCY